MTAGMAVIIAGVLSKHRKYVRNEDFGGVICDECGWEVASKWPEANTGNPTTDRATSHEAHAVLAALTEAGYGEPRTVTTAEELDALPVGSVVIDAFGAACVLINKSMYLGWRRCTPAVAGGEHRRSPYLPATVLYEPTPDPLAAALNDPEGHALVQAIHDRKEQNDA